MLTFMSHRRRHMIIPLSVLPSCAFLYFSTLFAKACFFNFNFASGYTIRARLIFFTKLGSRCAIGQRLVQYIRTGLARRRCSSFFVLLLELYHDDKSRTKYRGRVEQLDRTGGQEHQQTDGNQLSYSMAN